MKSKRKVNLTDLWVVFVVIIGCILFYYGGNRAAKKEGLDSNEEIEKTLRKYSVEIGHTGANRKESSVKSANQWINNVLSLKIPPILDRKWYVSLPEWLSNAEDLDVKLNEALVELHEDR